ncbi:DUF599 domain-containing protein [Plasticicumulans sp.]|uniref:DUF599 domain-containing protein n=1 Tax=Plasticicumulans sp. TaxID=2307179 RepID=UPI00393D3518
MTAFWSWGSLVASVLLIVGYEVVAHRAGRSDPTHQARFINARMRSAWAQAMSSQPGFEIVAVQALRNSLMSATVVASTAALALMGGLTLGGASLAAGLAQLPSTAAELSLHVVLIGLAIAVLFASYVCSAMSMRYYGNATQVMALPVASADRQRLNPLAVEYVQRAGRLYSWALRLFLMVVPAVAGVVHPYALLPSTAALLVALHFFDQPVPVEID